MTWNPETNDLVHRILVGVDGSACSLIAVAWAAGEARARGARLELMHVIEPGARRFLDPAEPDPAMVVATAAARLAASGITAHARITTGDAVEELSHRAEHADLLVLGATGMAPYHGILHGTVTQACVHAAPCPIVVVPFPQQQPSHPHRADAELVAGGVR
ncbi:MAG: universal stress protein [Mycobacteriales bacterium]